MRLNKKTKVQIGGTLREAADGILADVARFERVEKRRFFAVLRLGAIKSPADAVRAAIVVEHRSKGESP